MAVCPPNYPNARPLHPPNPLVPVQPPTRHFSYLGGYLHRHLPSRRCVKRPRSERHCELGPPVPYLVAHSWCASADLLCFRFTDHWHIQLGEHILDSTVLIRYDRRGRAV